LHTWLTAYDFPMAQFQEKAGIDIILVGDSIGMTTFGFDSTTEASSGALRRFNPTNGNGSVSISHPVHHASHV
jgi:ketopantoate hydroxymethyltransferase